ncbi:hypothetical protein DIU36_28035 [Mucilaginibacter rubeus]|nr:hypothetical protein DIU36_28035 [Mucilaginibacter rubeus]
MDYEAIASFDKIVNLGKYYPNCAILAGYELRLSRLLKQGADAWLNTPRLTREASGTSGMSAAMNGCVNVSIPDGWFPEFVVDRVNGFVVPNTQISEHEFQRDKPMPITCTTCCKKRSFRCIIIIPISGSV